jgi:hypothetical protein
MHCGCHFSCTYSCFCDEALPVVRGACLQVIHGLYARAYAVIANKILGCEPENRMKALTKDRKRRCKVEKGMVEEDVVG